MSYRRDAVQLDAAAIRSHVSRSFRGSDAMRNFCASCGSLVFGGALETSEELTIYAGSLDDAAAFEPTIAIFGRDRPAWAPLSAGIRVFDTLPGC